MIVAVRGLPAIAGTVLALTLSSCGGSVPIDGGYRLRGLPASANY